MSGQSKKVLQFPKLDKETLAFIKARLLLRSTKELEEIFKVVREVLEYKRINSGCPNKAMNLNHSDKRVSCSFSELAAYQFLAEESGDEIPD